MERSTSSGVQNMFWYSYLWHPISRSQRLGNRGTHYHRIALPNNHTTCGLAGLPVGVGSNDDSTKGRELPGFVVPDVGDQVANDTSKQRTKEEDAKDREQP